MKRYSMTGPIFLSSWFIFSNVKDESGRKMETKNIFQLINFGKLKLHQNWPKYRKKKILAGIGLCAKSPPKSLRITEYLTENNKNLSSGFFHRPRTHEQKLFIFGSKKWPSPNFVSFFVQFCNPPFKIVGQLTKMVQTHSHSRPALVFKFFHVSGIFFEFLARSQLWSLDLTVFYYPSVKWILSPTNAGDQRKYLNKKFKARRKKAKKKVSWLSL